VPTEITDEQQSFREVITQATGLPWDFVPTGGGCSALVAVFADGRTVRLTAQAEAPTLGESVFVELFGAGETEATVDAVCVTVAAVAAVVSVHGGNA